MERIIEKMEMTDKLVSQVLWSYGLQKKSPAKALGGGRIASNILVETQEMGEIIIRAYPHSYGEARVRFEVDVLLHLGKYNCNVPRPLSLTKNKNLHPSLLSLNSFEIFLYPALQGSSVSQSELNTPLASAAGKALASLVPYNKSFSPAELIPHGDLGFIAGLHRSAKERDPVLAAHPLSAIMEQVLSDGELVNGLAKTSIGIVHADYFFENVLATLERDKILGVIDYGDAYYGYLLNDAVIGAMEFAVLESEDWDIASFQAFLRENKGWLIQEEFSSNLMKKLLMANCIRFAMYTLPFSYAENQPFEQNKYVQRFLKIQTTQLGTNLENAWNDAVLG